MVNGEGKSFCEGDEVYFHGYKSTIHKLMPDGESIIVLRIGDACKAVDAGEFMRNAERVKENE